MTPPATRARTTCRLCGREVAFRFAHQRGGKPKAAHKCPHGQWCASGQRVRGIHANHSECRECRVALTGRPNK